MGVKVKAPVAALVMVSEPLASAIGVPTVKEAPLIRVTVKASDVGSLSALYVAGGYPDPEWLNAEVPNYMTNPSLLIVQDLFRSKLTERADFVLPATTAFEKDGTFVNHAGLAQSFPRAAKPGPEVRTELQLAFDIAERRGLATVAAVRKELAAAMPAFAGLAATNGKKLELATV